MKEIALWIMAIGLAACSQQQEGEQKASADAEEQPLPYLGQYDETIKKVNGKEVAVKEYETLPIIELIDQRGQHWSTDSIKGKPFAIYFFFTKCPGICPAMTNQMKRAHEAVKDLTDMHFVAVSIDPKRDSSATLQEYIRTFGLDDTNWQFLTGDKQYIQKIGYAYKANVMESDDPDSGGFLHSEHFMLVDGNRKLRGVYNGTETEDVDRMLLEMRLLIKEKHTWNKQ